MEVTLVQRYITTVRGLGLLTVKLISLISVISVTQSEQLHDPLLGGNPPAEDSCIAAWLPYLRDHVHSHCIASLGVEANVEIPASEANQELLQPSKPANNNSRGPFNTHIIDNVRSC